MILGKRGIPPPDSACYLCSLKNTPIYYFESIFGLITVVKMKPFAVCVVLLVCMAMSINARGRSFSSTGQAIVDQY